MRLVLFNISICFVQKKYRFQQTNRLTFYPNFFLVILREFLYKNIVLHCDQTSTQYSPFCYYITLKLCTLYFANNLSKHYIVSCILNQDFSFFQKKNENSFLFVFVSLFFSMWTNIKYLNQTQKHNKHTMFSLTYFVSSAQTTLHIYICVKKQSTYQQNRGVWLADGSVCSIE